MPLHLYMHVRSPYQGNSLPAYACASFEPSPYLLVVVWGGVRCGNSPGATKQGSFLENSFRPENLALKAKMIHFFTGSAKQGAKINNFSPSWQSPVGWHFPPHSSIIICCLCSCRFYPSLFLFFDLLLFWWCLCAFLLGVWAVFLWLKLPAALLRSCLFTSAHLCALSGPKKPLLPPYCCPTGVALLPRWCTYPSETWPRGVLF